MNIRHFELAAKTALRSDSKFRLGAVLAKRNRAISWGWNDMRRTHPIMREYNYDKAWVPGVHAEIDACLGVDRDDLNNADVYVVRIRKDGSYGLAKPCLICTRILKSMGISRAYYSTEEGYGIYEIQAD